MPKTNEVQILNRQKLTDILIELWELSIKKCRSAGHKDQQSDKNTFFE
jgi:hypothetical protein